MCQKINMFLNSDCYTKLILGIKAKNPQDKSIL